MATQQFGRYRIKRILGKGGMGIVYLGYDPTLDREVAIKVLPSYLTSDSSFLKNFQQEAHIVAKLQHPCIVSIYDYGEEDGEPYIVMPYMSGGSLQTRLAKGALEPSLLVPIVQRVASALDFAHAHNIIHRDLKPANILFDDEDLAYLSDFGIAKVIQATTLHTRSPSMGTPAYMSPEQGSGSKSLDGRSDIYSLGVVIFQALSGKLPYHADYEAGYLLKHIKEPIPDIAKVNPAVPSGCEVVIRQVLAKTPDQRYPKAGDLAKDLAKVVNDETIKPRPKLKGDVTEPVPVVKPKEENGKEPPPVAEVPKKKKLEWPKWLLLLIGLGLLVICGSTAVFAVIRYNSKPTVEMFIAQATAGITPVPIVLSLEATTSSPTPLPTSTSEPTSIDTPKPTLTNTPESIIVASPAATVMNLQIPSSTPTPSPTHTATNTSTPEPTLTNTSTPEPTLTNTPEPKPALTNTPTSEPTPANTPQPQPTPAPAITGRLAIPLMLGNEPKVYIVNIENGEFLNSLGAARQPDYSSDGTKLVVNGETGTEDKLRVSDALGRGTVQIGDQGLNGHSHPAWSPDGTQVIYDDVTIDPTGWRIFFRDLNSTSGPGTLLQADIGPIIGRNPLWMTKDHFIFRGCNTWGNNPSDCGIWVMQGNNDSPQKLTSNPNHIPTDVLGDTVVYVSNELGSWDVYSLNIATGVTKQLTSRLASEGLPTISPDGRTVAFLSNEGGLGVWVVNLNGGEPKKLFNLPSDWGAMGPDSWFEEKLSWGAD